MLLKHAQIQMSYDVSEKEINNARLFIKYFEKFNSKLNLNKDHLDEIFNSFKESPDKLDPEELYSKRYIFRNYKEQVEKNFNELIQLAVYCLSVSNYFSTDSQIQQLISSFNDYIEDLQKQIGFFDNCFNDLKDKDFGKNIVEVVKGIKKKSAQIEQLIKERIIVHIKKNIIGENWATEISKKDNISLEKPLPFTLQLQENRLEQLKNNSNKE